MQHEIITSHLRLRPLTHQDAARLVVLANDKQVSDTLLHIPHPFVQVDAEEMVAQGHAAAAEGTAYHYGVQLGTDLIGVASLVRTNGSPSSAYVVYWLGVAYWGQGYSTEAAQAIIDHGFETLGLESITAKHAPWNHASARVLKKVGMTYQGIKPKAVFRGGQWLDSSFWSISASDAAAAWPVE